MKAEERNERLMSSTAYLRNTFEGIVFRSTPEGKFFARWPGESEYEITWSANILMDALFEWDEITKELADATSDI